MPTRNYFTTSKDGFGHVYPNRVRNQTWYNSPRVSGKLVLQANAYSLEDYTCSSFSWDEQGCAQPQPYQFGGATAEAERARLNARNQAYDRYRGKLYKGKASLGVTVGSYSQSRAMIVSRARSISEQAEEILSDFGRRYQVRGRAAVRLASGYLETVFGWKPLLADIHAATQSVIQQADKRGFVRGSGTTGFSHNKTVTSPDKFRKERVTVNGTARVTFAAGYTVTNDNLWLAERAGLLNPLSVAWDLVPWSFVVNMFANTGALVNSVTDFAGISFDNASETTTFHTSGSIGNSYIETFTWPYPHTIQSFGSSSWSAKNQVREVGAVPSPSFQLKLPDANWELAAIASSLMVQQVSRVGQLVRPYYMARSHPG